MTSILSLFNSPPLTVMASVEQLMLVVAIAASTVAVIQMILAMFGIDHDSDVDVDHDFDHDGDHDASDAHGGFFTGIFSVRNVIAFLAMFSWTALWCIARGIPDPWAMMLSGFVGSVFVLILQTLFFIMSRMRVDATARTADAVGQIAEVYIPIPEQGKGSGRVFVTLNESKRELSAVSNGPKLSRGARVKVFEVENGALVVGPAN